MPKSLPFEGSIIALDIAKSTGVAEGRPGENPVLSTLKFEREFDNAPDIFGRGVRWMTQRFKAAPLPALVVVESIVPQYDKTIQSGLWGVFTGMARALEIPVLVAPIQTWRTQILGQGDLPGPMAKERAIELCYLLQWAKRGDKGFTHDAAEAACQWLWACQRVAPQIAQSAPFFMRVSIPKKKRPPGVAVFKQRGRR